MKRTAKSKTRSQDPVTSHLEARAIRAVLNSSKGKTIRAARLLGMNKTVFERKVRQYRILKGKLG